MLTKPPFHLLLFKIPVALLLFAGCGPRDATSLSSPGQSVEQAFENLDESSLKPTGQGLSGEGRLLAREALRGINSREHYILEATNWQEKGTLILHSHLNDFSLRDGVQIEMRRQGQDLMISVSTPDYPFEEVTTLTRAFPGGRDRVRLRFEVHDGVPEGLRLLIWKDLLPGQGELIRPLPFIAAANASYDSREQRMIWRSHGRGIRWGLQISGLTLKSALREAPYVQD